ncbi:MAG: helix-turn-helix transcriptional regulator [Vagococcus sp.]
MNRIHELRKEAGLTQVELAKKIGVSDASINKYEKGIMLPKIDKLEKMADLFKVSTDYLTGKSNSRLGYSESWDNLAKKMNSKDTNYNLKPISSDAELSKKALLLDFEKLNELGRKEALKQIKNLTKISDYKLQ